MRDLILLTTFTALLAGCATAPQGAVLVDNPSQIQSMQQVFADRLARLKIGMPLDAFRQVFAEAYVAGQNEKVTAYEMAHVAKYVTQTDIAIQNIMWGIGSPRARGEKQVLWFYFYKDQLVKWGRPQDWPQNPDKIIEIRGR
jgi:hypothetical protein